MVVDKEKEEREVSLLGNNVWWFREKLGLKSKDLASKMNYSTSWLSKLETGKRHDKVSSEDINRLAYELGTSADILMGREKEINTFFEKVDSAIKLRTVTNELIADVEELISTVQDKYGPRDISETIRLRGNIDFIHGNFASALTYYQRALEISEHAEDHIMTHTLRLNIAKTFYSMKDYGRAQKQIIENLADKYNQNRIYEDKHLLGLVYCQLEKWEQAITVLTDAIMNTPMKSETNRLLGKSYQYLGGACLFLDMYDQAIIYSEKSVELSLQNRDFHTESFALRTIGNARKAKGDVTGAVKNLLAAHDVLPESYRGDKLEIQYYLALCMEDGEEAYKKVLSIVDELELFAHPRFMARVYEYLTHESFVFEYYGNAKIFHKKTIQMYQAIVR